MIVRQTVHAKTRRGNKRPEGEILFYNLRGCKLNMTHDHEATWDTDIPLMITFQKTKQDRQFRVGKRPEGEIRCKLNITHDHEANRELNIRITKRKNCNFPPLRAFVVRGSGEAPYIKIKIIVTI